MGIESGKKEFVFGNQGLGIEDWSIGNYFLFQLMVYN